MSATEFHGPVDYLVVEYPGEGIGSGSISEIVSLVDSGVIRLFDLMVVGRAADGTVASVDLADTALASLAGARSGLLGDDDVRDVGAILQPGATALVVVFENAWAIPFVAAARGEGGEMIATARITAQEMMDALDAADAAS